MIDSTALSWSMFLTFVLTEFINENIRSTTALLTGVIKHVNAKLARSLKFPCCLTQIQNISVSAGYPCHLKGSSSLQSTKGSFDIDFQQYRVLAADARKAGH